MQNIPETVTKDFCGKRVAIIGDIVADQFLHGTITRVSREAPVFIMRHDETETRPGGAANAAANIASLGGEPRLVGLVGDDSNGRFLMEALRRANVASDRIAIVPGRKTTTKVRILAGREYAGRQQVIRIDHEDPAMIGDDVRRKMLNAICDAIDEADAVVVSDYAYGVVDPDMFQFVHEMAMGRHIPVIVDSRVGLESFSGATAATPNQEEIERILGRVPSDEDCEALRERLGLEALLVTRGNKGMLLLESGRPAVSIEAVGSKQPVDVTGAGDTVIAAYSLGLASGFGHADAASVANHAGGIVVMKKGTATVTMVELVDSIRLNDAAANASITAV
jgi:D-glycero-beta-D-manno-heptose-7-phosphate kinase